MSEGSAIFSKWKGVFCQPTIYNGDIRGYARTFSAMNSLRKPACIRHDIFPSPLKPINQTSWGRDTFSPKMAVFSDIWPEFSDIVILAVAIPSAQCDLRFAKGFESCAAGKEVSSASRIPEGVFKKRDFAWRCCQDPHVASLAKIWSWVACVTFLFFLQLCRKEHSYPGKEPLEVNNSELARFYKAASCVQCCIP